MSENNQEKYTNSLLAGHDKNNAISKYGILKFKVQSKTVEKIKEIKNYMEWDTNTTINSSLTYLYKNLGFDGLPKNILLKGCEKEIKFTPTFKNSQRLETETMKGSLDLAFTTYIIAKSVDELYSRLLKADK